MGNTRGNSYSRNHVTFDPCSTCPDFWNFGFDDSGVFGYKAEVDYILEITSQGQIHFVGHSMGTTQFLKYGSEEKGSSLCRFSILLGFIMSKKQERLRSELLSEDKIRNLLGFLHNKTQEDGESTK